MKLFNIFTRVSVPVFVVLTYLIATFGHSAAAAEEAAVTAGGDATSGFLRLDLGKGRILFVNNAMAFESYDNWIIDPSSFEFKKRQKALSKRDKNRLKDLLVKARAEQTEQYGQVVQMRSPCTLTQRLHLKNLQLHNSNSGGSQVNFVKSYGETMIVAEIKESVSDKLVFAYTEKVSLGGGMSGGGGPRMDRLSKALKMVMANAHSVLLDVLPLQKERIADRSEFGCQGQIGKNTMAIRAQRAEQRVD